MAMMQWLIGPQTVGAVMLFSGWIQQTYPPTDVDGPYGYKTAASRKNQQTFDEGNRYSAKLMMRLGLIAVVLGLAIAPFIDKKHEIIMPALMLIAGIGIAVTVIVLTEKHLNKLFE